MRSVDDAMVLADDHALCSNDDPIGIDPEADRTIGKRGRHAVAIALQMHQAGRGDPLGIFDKAIERTRCRHQSWRFFGPEVGNGAAHLAMGSLGPEFPASAFQPVVGRIQGGKARYGLPEPVSGILHVLLDLAFLPA